MMRLLFVDDERAALDGLQRSLYSHRHEWEMHFAHGGQAALKYLEDQPLDMVISDIRMPGMDGMALLKAIRERWPGTVRIALSGYADRLEVMRATLYAHQYLSKPCTPEDISRVITQTLKLRALLDSPALSALVGSTELPALPETYTRLTELLADPDVDFRAVARLIGRDPAMSARMLQLVNSAFFGLPRTLSKIEDAVMYLGVKMLKDLVLSVGVFGQFALDRDADVPLKSIQRHSLGTAALAAALLESSSLAESAFTAGVIHDAGTLLMAVSPQVDYGALVRQARAQRRAVHAVERERLGVSHAELGAYLFGVWGLPHDLVEAVLRHHDPGPLAEGGLDLAGALHVADALAYAGPAGHPIRQLLAPSLVTSPGFEDALASWEAVAKRCRARRAA